MSDWLQASQIAEGSAPHSAQVEGLKLKEANVAGHLVVGPRVELTLADGGIEKPLTRNAVWPVTTLLIRSVGSIAGSANVP